MRFGQDIVELAGLLSTAFLARKSITDEQFLNRGLLEKFQAFLFAPHTCNQIHNHAFKCLMSALNEASSTTCFNYVRDVLMKDV